MRRTPPHSGRHRPTLGDDVSTISWGVWRIVRLSLVATVLFWGSVFTIQFLTYKKPSGTHDAFSAGGVLNPAWESQQRAEAERSARDQRLAAFEASPLRLPMRQDLSPQERARCRSIWLTRSGRTVLGADNTLKGFPDEIGETTPHPPECY